MAVPADMPVMAPVVMFTVVMAVALLIHVPPAGVHDRADILPMQADAVPPMADGWVFTVTIAVL